MKLLTACKSVCRILYGGIFNLQSFANFTEIFKTFQELFFNGTETVQVTPLTRTLASSSES